MSDTGVNWEDWILIALGVFAGIVLIRKVFANDANKESLFSLINNIFYAFSSFLAFGLISFGFIADIVGAELRYSIASIGSIVAMIINYVFSFVISSFNPNIITPQMASLSPSGSGWCSIPGAERLESFLFPNAIVASTTSLMYLIISSAVARSSMDTIMLAGIGAGIIVAQLVAMQLSGCISSYGQFGFQSGVTSVIGALVLGGVFGSILFGIVKAAAPVKLPFYTFSSGGGGGDTATRRPALGGASKSGGACQAIDGESDAFVCEAYKNGQLVTEELA